RASPHTCSARSPSSPRRKRTGSAIALRQLGACDLPSTDFTTKTPRHQEILDQLGVLVSCWLYVIAKHPSFGYTRHDRGVAQPGLAHLPWAQGVGRSNRLPPPPFPPPRNSRRMRGARTPRD